VSTEQNQELSPIKQALLELREMRARVTSLERERNEPIAIVGIGCRFPGAPTPDAFWQLLHDGRDAIREVPRDRWNIDDWFDSNPDAPGKMSTRHGGFLDRVDGFDARFFGITPREAATMDPQQRLLLEVAWEALEHGCIAPDRLQGDPVGVFIGLSATDYLHLQLQNGDPGSIDAYLGSGSSPAVASGRLAYFLGLQGPTVTVDTACSSSLVALHLACHSLRTAECRMALAGGVSLMLVPEWTVNFSKARMLAADGRCKTFDAAADGYVRSEGCGIVVLKRLSDAIADGDRVLAVVRSSAVNQDGRSSGLTVPNGPAQEALIRDALSRGGLAPRDVSYVEAHGTGTALGDPIELGALGSVFSDRPGDDPLLIGSVKTNIGHLEAAAGIAGVIKVVLALQNEEIPPHIHFKTPTPHVNWSDLRLRVPTAPVRWPRGGTARVAGVSSFGFSGTNAHVVIEEAPALAARVPEQPSVHVLPLSAKSAPALIAQAQRMSRYLDEHHDVYLGDVCFSAAIGRAAFPHRLAVVTDSLADASRRLTAFPDNKDDVESGVNLSPTAPGVVFLFTGQGSQYVGMGQALYESIPVFRETLDRCAELLRPHLKHPLLSVMFGRDQLGGLLDETAYTQPALFALEYALSETWRSYGVVPSAVIGHSLGEDVAACVAGVFSLAEGLEMIAARGRLMQALPRDGEMYAAFTDEATVRRAARAFPRTVSIAAINAPENITFSGRRDDVRAVVRSLEGEGIKVRPVTASHAFHSPLVDPMLDEFERCAARVSYSAPIVPFVSNITGDFAGAETIGSGSYWRRHVRETVRFEAGIRTLWNAGYRVFLEIGPHPVLLPFGQRVAEEGGTWLPSLRNGRDGLREMMTSLASLFVNGVNVDWRGVHRGHARARLSLPTYPFERQRHWIETRRTHVPPAASRWERATEAARRQASVGPLDLALPTYADKWARLDEIAIACMARVLRAAGIFGVPGESLRAEDVAVRLSAQPIYARLIARWLRTLAGVGWLRADGDRFTSDVPLPEPDVAALVNQSKPLFTDFPAPLDYIARCGEKLAEVVSGRENALDTLFPEGSSHLADQLYSTSALARYSNAIVHSAIAALAQDATPDRPLRVLEIGAGTGGTTAGLLPLLDRTRTRYCFTDIGSLFVAKARERFAAFDFVSYRTLDIERSPLEQGFAPHSFDVILAANAIHATKNLHEALDHTATLLASGGLLVLCETTRHPVWFDVTTGLIGGWQRFSDDLRDDVPLIPVSTWDTAVRQHGYDAFFAVPEAGSPAEVLGQHVLIARGPRHAADSVEVPVVAEAGAAVAPGERPSSADGADVRARLERMPASERHEALVAFVTERIVRILRLDPSAPPDRAQRLMDLGVDSLMAVEIRNDLTAMLSLERRLPATLIFDYPTIEAIARHLEHDAMQLPPDRGEAAADVRPDPAADSEARLAELEDMSDEEVEALLNKRLETL